MSFKTVYDLITANIDSNDYFQLRKEMIVRVFLYIATVILILFTFINLFIYKNYPVAFLDIIASIISLYSIKKLKNRNTLNLAVNISSFNLFFFFLIFLILNKNNDNGLFWIMFLPIFIIPLNGHNRGLIISLIFYAIAFTIAYFGIDEWQNGNWNFHSYIRFVISSLVLLYVIYVNELAIYRSNVLLSEKEKENKEYLKKLQEMAQI
ncbi:hypothetical protein [Hydrogenimonas thermophila]|uniref:MASE6 domain-containing protein n=1 Tax=Hydrogenimonas thermophila TaxID=223786 RepID=A0A1I5M9V1_9BACT|nr:hypothetical protein [Hydrogenimonas thermophila]SFP06273.1 hypothetical protein SAMN05216234_10573 [Hydrogenimonas thermophila]